MKLIVGLGNPGEKYANSRHNLGFMVLDAFLKEFEPLEKTFWEEDRKGKVLTKDVKNGSDTFILAKPQTFMNDSGRAVSYLLNYYKVSSEDLIIIYDDLDLPLGKVRVRFGGAAGGHKGVESIINTLQDDKFLRMRLGIGHPSRQHYGKLKEGKSYIAVEDYVIANFTAPEKSKVKHMIKEASRALHLILEHGIDKYMSKYNNEVKTDDVEKSI